MKTTESLYTNRQITQASGVPLRTFHRWQKEGYVSEEERGGGRGRSSKFVYETAIQAKLIDEAFAVWPHADCPIYLHDKHTDPELCYWSDGKRILEYIRSIEPHEFWDKGKDYTYDLIFVLLRGTNDQTGKRFAEAHLQPHHLAKANMARYWENPFFTSKENHLADNMWFISLHAIDKFCRDRLKG
jgi:hypothetical protein